jgi:hypothetical protein
MPIVLLTVPEWSIENWVERKGISNFYKFELLYIEIHHIFYFQNQKLKVKVVNSVFLLPHIERKFVTLKTGISGLFTLYRN